MKLLSPLKIGPIELKNRLVSTAHAAFLDFWQPGSDGQRYIAYQERRARGGTGLIILTAQHVHESSSYPGHFQYEKTDLGPKLVQMSTQLHRHGTRVISQLFHVGVNGKGEFRSDLQPLWGMSGTISAEGEAAHEMSEDEIETIIQAFVDAAVVAVENGMDGVELHAAHGYLLQQSFSPFANKRTDKWGQPLCLTKTVAQRVRQAIGSGAVLGLRLCIEDFLTPEHGGVGHERLCQIGADLMATGLFDYLNHSEGSMGAHYAKTIGSYRYPFGQYLPLTRSLKNAIDSVVPVLGVGKIATTDLAEKALQDGDCDLIGMTRAQISDPDIGLKLQTGQTHRIRMCTGGNQGCIDRAGATYPITCFHNPEVGEEGRFRELDKAIAVSKRVLVVGGGPAGMKAAEIAARRGHQVTLVEASDRLGGRLNLVQPFGEAASLLGSTAWIEQELTYLKVQVLTQTTVDEAFVREMKPDTIILATGATASNDLGVPTDGSVPVLSIDEVAQSRYQSARIDFKGARCVMFDQRASYETALITEHLAKSGCALTVATPALHFGANMGFTHLLDYMGLLPKWDVDVRPQHVIASIAEGKVNLLNVFSGAITPIESDLVVAGIHPKPNNELYDVLRAYAPVQMAGDVLAPRTALEAFREGDRAARTLG